MTTGEMLGWTTRFKEIMSASKDLRNHRLLNLRNDLSTLYNVPTFRNEKFAKENPFVIQLYLAVAAEL